MLKNEPPLKLHSFLVTSPNTAVRYLIRLLSLSIDTFLSFLFLFLKNPNASQLAQIPREGELWCYFSTYSYPHSTLTFPTISNRNWSCRTPGLDFSKAFDNLPQANVPHEGQYSVQLQNYERLLDLTHCVLN